MSRSGWTAVAAVGVVWGAGALGQVQADDHPDQEAAVIGLGVTHGRFDHRSPRAVDADVYRFEGEQGRLYRATFALDPHPAEATVQFGNQVWSDPGLDNSPWMNLSAGVAPWLFRVAASGRMHFQALGLAFPDGTSYGYSLRIEDLGFVPDDVPGAWGEARPLALGEVFDGSVTPAGDSVTSFAGDDVDLFTVPTLAGRHYRIELEGVDVMDASLWSFTNWYVDATDPREPPETRYGWPPVFGADQIDTVVSGTLCFGVAGRVTDWPAQARYRVRVVDEGPAWLDDHSDWPLGATPLTIGQPVSAVLGDMYRRDSYRLPRDEDWFAVDLQAGHGYRARVQTPLSHGFDPGVEFVVMQPGGFDTVVPSTPYDVREFKATVSGRYYIRVYSSTGVHPRAVSVEDMGPLVDDHADSGDGEQLIVPASVNGVIENALDTDLFRVSAPSGAVLRVTLSGADTSTFPVILLVSQGTSFQRGSGQARYSFSGEPLVTDVAVTPQEPNGTVWIAVTATDFGGSNPYAERSYTLTVEIVDATVADDWPDTASGARLLAAGERVPVRQDRSDDRDVFLVDLVAGHLYRVFGAAEVSPVTGPSSDPFVHGPSLLQPATSGRYQLSFYSDTAAAGFEDLGAVPDDYPWMSQPPRVAAGVSIEGAIDFAGDVDTLEIVLEEAGVYALEIAGAEGVSAAVTTNDPLNRFGPSIERTIGSGANAQSPNVALFGVTQRTGVVPVLTLTLTSWREQVPTAYTVRVRLVQPFRPSLGGGQTMQEATAIALDEFAAAAQTRVGQYFWYRVPVSAGHLYTIVGSGESQLRVVSFEVANGDGTVVCDLADRWVSSETGWAYVRIKGWQNWHRFVVHDLGPSADDAPAALDGARQKVLGETIVGRFDFSGDVDAFRLPLLHHETYLASIELESANGQALYGEASAALNVPGEYDPSQFSRLSPAAPVALQLQEWNTESGLFALRWDSAGDSGSYPIVYRVRVWRYCPADLAGPGADPHPDGVADANDLIYFIDRFFAADPVADIGSVGGTPRPDGRFDNNDLIVYIDRFFAGCP